LTATLGGISQQEISEELGFDQLPVLPDDPVLEHRARDVALKNERPGGDTDTHGRGERGDVGDTNARDHG
jgi:hypothetical protein